jgi:hypothetical protein
MFSQKQATATKGFGFAMSAKTSSIAIGQSNILLPVNLRRR